MRKTGLIFLSLLAVLVAHTLVTHYLSVAGIVPDIPLIALVFIALRNGQIPATVTGFGMGLALDLLSGNDGMLGLSALSKTAGGFLAGYFYNENKSPQMLGGYQFVLLVAGVSLVHNLIYFLIFLQGSGIGWSAAILRYAIPTALYTATISLLPMFIISRRNLSPV